MSTIEIEDGETEKIIPDDQADVAYIAEVQRNDIRISHSERYAREGTTLSSNEQHRIDNLRGEQLYAYAFDGPVSIRMTHAAANVETNPSSDVNVVESVDVTGSVDANVGTIDAITETVTVDGAVDASVGSVDAITETVTVDGAVDASVGSVDAITETVTVSGTVSLEDTDPIHDATTGAGSANAAQLQLGPRTAVDVHFDVAAETTIHVEVSPDGATWYEHTTVTDTGTDMILLSSGFEHVRAFAESDVNTIAIGAKGA